MIRTPITRMDIYAPHFTERLFNRMSQSYDAVNYWVSFGCSERWRKQLLSHIPIAAKEPIEVLDLMTGRGEMWQYLHQSWENAHIHALDFSEAMLQAAERKNKARNIQILKANALATGLPDASFDLIVCSFGLKTFNSIQQALLAQEVKRLLKPTGHFAFIEVSEPSHWWLRPLFTFHLQHIVPFVAQFFLGESEEYKMLWQYTHAFKNTHATQQIFENIGLKSQFDSYFLGCATGFHGQKR